jgi:dienelactone hydrolase
MMLALSSVEGLLALLILVQDTPVERWLAEKDPARRAKLAAEIKGSPAEVEAELRKLPRRSADVPRGPVVRKRLKAEHPAAVEFEYVLLVPAAYSPEKAWRLLIDLHGQTGTGEDALKRWRADLDRDGETFLLGPSAGRGGWGRSLLGHAYILTALRDVTATYQIDPDLVFLDGASMGGNGSFQFACTYPDLFAGAAPRSGGPFFRYLPQPAGMKERPVKAEGVENLFGLPVYWVVGARDPDLPNAWVKTALAQMQALKLDLVFREHPEGGHEWFPQENPNVLEWMKPRRRNPYPPQVAVYTTDRKFARNFWLEVAEFRGKENVLRRFPDVKNQVIEERQVFLDEIQVRAELLPEGNEIKVTASGAKELRLWLHERMLDLSKPLTVTVNGAKSKVDAKPSVATLLESAARYRGLLYTASIKVPVR